MLRIIFVILLLVHALIHLLGFAKAFNIGSVTQLSQNISKPLGLAWLLAAFLFTLSMLLFLWGKSTWTVSAFGAVLLSQILIFSAWQDAKFGTIANILVLLLALTAFGSFRFSRQIALEQKELLNTLAPTPGNIITNEDLKPLPEIVQKWLKMSGVMHKPPISAERLKQKGEMRTKADAKWMSFRAEQYFNPENPSFVWSTQVKMLPLIYLQGRDRLEEGEGEMLIKLFGLVNVVKEGPNEKINEGSMQRFLAEMCWFPSAALNDYVKWEEVSDLSAKATFTLKGQAVSGIFTFRENGEIVSFEADRYYGGGTDSRKEKWLVETLAYKEFDGWRLPAKNKVTWQLAEGDFNWLNLEITALQIDKREVFE